MIIGSMVLMPWPTSGFFAMIVTTPSAAMRMKAFGANVAGRLHGACAQASATGSRYVASSRPPPASALTRRNERRSTVAGAIGSS